MYTIFLSDLHLGLENPDRLNDFKSLMRGPALKARAVYLLGDLCEQFWVGNDDTTPPNQEILNEILEFTRHGIPLYFIKGNRELLIDEDFALLTGATMLPDSTVIDLDGKRVLIMHGDLLCSDDYSYQWFRRFMTSPFFGGMLKRLPLKMRTGLARSLKPVFNRSTMNKPGEIMDVRPESVTIAMRDNKVNELIHGHTHRPGIEEFELDNTASRRIVLGDWYHRAEILVCKNDERRLVPVSEFLENDDLSGISG